MRPLGQDPNDSGIRRLLADPALVGSGGVSPTLKGGSRITVEGLLPHHQPAKLRREHGAAQGFALIWARRYRTKIFVTDVVLIVLSVLLCSQLVGREQAVTWERTVVVDVGISAMWLIALWLCHTRDPRLVGHGPGEYKKIIRASAAAFGWLAVAFLFANAHHMDLIFLLTMPLGTAALLVGRWSWRRWLNRQRAYGHYLSRVIVLGKEDDVTYVVEQIIKNSGASYEVVGVALEGESKERVIMVGQARVPVVAGLDGIFDAVEEFSADAVIVAGQVSRGSNYLKELGWKLEESATELVVALSLTNVAGPRIQMRPVEGLPLMHVDLPRFTGYKHLLKRSVDILASFLALLVLLPVFAVLAVLIKRDSLGPVFFHQKRVGRDGTIFEMHKFRSMGVNAEEELQRLTSLNQGSGPLFKLRQDPRVTKVGEWMRRHSLDELPQFFNVLKGQMSLVGPRPPLPSEVANYDSSAYRRLYIKPGVTGLWQVSGRSDLSWQESVRLDLYYVENWSLTGDLMIMWRTFRVMLAPEGAY